MALVPGAVTGSTQQCFVGQGEIFTNPGGSTPRFKHTTKAAATVLIFSLEFHFATKPSAKGSNVNDESNRKRS